MSATPLPGVVFLSAVRTPFGTFGGKLKDVSPIDLAVHASKAAIVRAGLPATEIDQTIFGNVLYTTSDSIYFARHVALKSGGRQETSALTLNRLCGSGFQAVVSGAQEIILGDAQVCLVGGAESTPQAPHVTRGRRWGTPLGKAAAMVIASEKFARERQLKPLGRLVSWGVAGVDPSVMGIGPVPASKAALAKAGMSMGDMDLIEVNEAFAAQTCAVERELSLPRERLNVHGGAIALSHPLAASGARITAHLLHALRAQGLRYGLGTACIGGGQGIALVVESIR